MVKGEQWWQSHKTFSFLSCFAFYRAMLRIARLSYDKLSVCLFVCLSVCLSVTLRYCEHTGWNTSKTISRLISLRFLLLISANWSNGNTPKFRLWSWVARPEGRSSKLYGLRAARGFGAMQRVPSLGCEVRVEEFCKFPQWSLGWSSSHQEFWSFWNFLNIIYCKTSVSPRLEPSVDGWWTLC